MVAQYYDNVWLYTKDISNKFDADNRLEYGISKDLVADAIRDFGVKLYSSNFNTNDLFTAFLGLTPSGSTFPFPEITGSVVDGNGDLAIPSGYEYVDTKISASNDIVPLNDVQKQVYKRIYHNIPYLLKTKGTVAGIRALITSYGIPDTILRISEFGGKDRNESQDYDLKQDVFNYAFDTGASATNFISSSLEANTKFPVQAGTNKARTVQLRFKPSEIPLPTNNVANSNIRYSQSLWSTDDGGNLLLEYTGSGFVTGSYSGSIASPYDTYGTLKFVPAEDDNPALSASVYLPFFNGDWWSVQMNVGGSPSTASLYSANEIDGKIGFNESSSTVGFDDAYYFDATTGFLNKDTNTVFTDGTTYTPFSGSFQELRYYVNEISQSHFYDYTVNPYSNEGNGINSTPNQQFFRAALGTQLDTGSRTSIHPRVTGSAVQITQSFATNSEFYINSSRFVTNVEDIFQDQVPAGIKNRITNKIQLENLILAEAPYGFKTPTSSKATISSTTSDVLSPMESIQQHSFVSQSYTPNVNYLEVAFSPSNQINDDINAQLGYFNLGDYIGDPRFISSSDYSYPNLNRLRDSYFEKYIRGYDVVDFIRLIKFFDNSLFKMIKDFTPARTSLASGVVVKQHLLERNRQRPAQATSSIHNYEGLVVNLPKDYSSGSSDFPQYSTEGSALYKFSGGPGGSFNKFNGLQTYPSGSKGLGPDNIFEITQSWQDRNDGSVLNTTNFNQSSSQFISGSYLGPRTFPKQDQSEFYNGVFSGSMIIVTTQSLNPGCDPYLNANDTPVVYTPLFFGTTPNVAGSVVTQGVFDNSLNVPPAGYAWISSRQTKLNGGQQVESIKLSQNDANGIEVINYLDDFDNLRVIFTDAIIPYNEASTEYIITGRTIFADHIILQVSQTQGNNIFQTVDGVDYFPITSSIDGGSMNWSLSASTNYQIGTANPEANDNVMQGVFKNPNLAIQEQNYFFWNGDVADELKFFNTGSEDINTSDILSNPLYAKNGAYTIPYTPNIPWRIKADIKYTTSINTGSGGTTTNSAIYHTGSSYQNANLTNQNFTLGEISSIGLVYEGSNGSGYATINAAISSSDLSNTDTEIYFSGNIFGSPEAIYGNATLGASGDSSDLDFNTERYYKFSNLDQNTATPPKQYYFIVYVTADNAPNAQTATLANTINPPNLFPTTNVSAALASAGGVGENTTFQPAPLSVSGLGTVLFNDGNYNTQIPGGSGSGVPVTTLGGHPKFKVASTSSLFWDFTSLELDGIAPTLAGGTNAFAPFSGSAALPGPPANNDFTANFPLGSNWSSNTFAFSPTTQAATPNGGAAGGGEILVDVSKVVSKANQTGNNPNYINRFVFRITLEIDGMTTGDSMTVGFEYYDIAAAVWNDITTTALSTTGTTSPTINVVNQSAQFFWDKGNFGGNPPPSGFWTDLLIRPKVKNTRTDGADFDYTISTFIVSMKMLYQYRDSNNFFQNREYPSAIGVFGPAWNGNGGSGTDFQAGSNILKSNASGGDRYSTAIVDAYLKRTGSDGDFIITASIFDSATLTGGYSGSIYSGSLLTFSESPITASGDFAYDPSNLTTTGSTRGQIGDMYYVEYSMSNFKGGVLNNLIQESQNVAFKSDINYPFITITSSAAGAGGGGAFDASGFVRFRQGNTLTNTTNVGDIGTSLPFALVNNAGTQEQTIEATYPGPFNANDINRFSIELRKTDLSSEILISEFTASIFPDESIWSPLPNATPSYGNFRTGSLTDFIVPTYYGDVIPFNLALDCQPLLNNFILQRQSEFIMDIDYNNQLGSLTPVNQKQILEGTAVKATVPDSNYTTLSSINPRYNGVKSTSAKLNVWSVGDFGTYGKTPTVELRDAYFGYFNDLDDPYPNINGVTRVNLSYLVDEQGNALPPSLEPITIDTFNAVFPNTTLGKLAVRDISSKYQDLGSPSPISRTMEYVTPICYSQNSGENYSTIIPLSGSGYISRYDIDNSSGRNFGKFTAVGPTLAIAGAQVQSVDYVLNPQNATKTPDISENYLPYSPATGITQYPSAIWGFEQDDLDNEQIISIQTSVVTTYVMESKSSSDELKLHFQMFYRKEVAITFLSSTFNLEYIDCKVYTETGQVYLIKNVDSYGWFKIVNLANQQNTGPRYNSSLDRWTTSRVLVPDEGIVCTVAFEMYDTLFDLGLMRERRPKNGSGVIALEWIFSANSGPRSIKADGGIKWNMKGTFRNAKVGQQQGFFFPAAYTGEYTPTKIQGAGVFDHLMSEPNQAAAPYWVTGGQANDSAFTSLDLSIIVMQSPNFNDSYGTSYYQGDVPYLPGTSQYFPGNVEPKTTAFDPIENPLEIIIGDEIRFANNENFTYRVLNVFPPQENIGTDSKGRVKLKLDRDVDGSINKDFFIVRRKVVNPNSLYLDTPFPYGILSSGSISQVIVNTGSNSFGLSGNIDTDGNYTASISNLESSTTPGILFPDFPTEYLIQSASIIVNDLISKGIIDS